MTVQEKLEEMKEQIVRMYTEEKKGSDTIAKTVGLSPSSILRALKKWGVVVKKDTSISDAMRKDKDEILRRYSGGESLTSIAKDYGTQGAMLNYLFTEWGIELRENKWGEKKPKLLSKALGLYDTGLSIIEISDILEVKSDTVSGWLKESGRDTLRYSSAREIPVRTFKKEIVNRYLAGEGCTVLSQFYNCAESTISEIIKEEGIQSDLNHRKYEFNEDYFEKIDSWMKAYWLGWIITDGNNSGNSVRLSITDKHIVKKLKECVGINCDIDEIPGRKSSYKTQYRLCLNSVKMCEDLAKLGVIKNKTHHTFYPDIPEEFDAAFILGCLEGDGSIHGGMFSSAGGSNVTVSWIGNNKLMLGIKNKLEFLNCRHKFYSCKNSKPNIVVLRYAHTEDAIKILDYLYKDAEYFLNRKHKRYKMLKKI